MINDYATHAFAASMDESESRWEQVKDVLHRALQLPPEQRGIFLEDACSSSHTLLTQIKSLLAAGEEIRASFMQSPSSPGPAGRETDVSLEAGQLVAQRFEIVRKLGEGGMGQVWLAVQVYPVQRQVALKLIRAGMYDETIARRFLSERQSLALMDHPAIAKVFDAGTTPQGQPYMVMEYVAGLPITEFCDSKKLSIRERLELFIQVCEGVQHAHRKAIMHRDLKPENILLIEVDGKPVPRIIDFGLAKAATSETADGLRTQIGLLMGTPGYMSPEQADPTVQDIDTRTDVYSLGAILYALLAGSHPLAALDGERLPLHEVLRKLREEEPLSPSVRVSGDQETLSATAEARSIEPSQLVRLLRGDLDWITMKALEKNRDRRYGTPAELADDIHRYLNHEPVIARPARASYRLRKYVRRHSTALAITAGLVMLLAAFAILQEVQLRRITRERDRASRERDRATRITDFMTGMFKISDPNQTHGNSVTAREMLDKASNEITSGMAADPEAQAQMMQVMATSYLHLGLYPHARELARRALDLRMKILPPDDSSVLESMTELGWILDREGHFSDAENMERRAFKTEVRLLGNQDPLTIEAGAFLAGILEDEGKSVEAEGLARDALNASRHRLGAENPQTLQAISFLARALWYQARYTEAEKEYRELAAMDNRVLGGDHPQTLAALSSIGATLYAENRFVESEQVDRQVLAVQRRVLGENHQALALTISNLAVAVRAQGRLQDAEKLHREALAIRTRVLGADHAETLTTETNLADVLFGEGRLQEAEKLQRQALAAQVRVLGSEFPDTLWSQSNLAGILIREGRYAEGEKLARDAYLVQVRVDGPTHPSTLDTMRQLGNALALQHKYGEASRLFRDAIAKNTDSTHGNRYGIWYLFACVAATANRTHESIQYLQEAIRRGYTNADGLLLEDDLKHLRGNPAFESIIADLRSLKVERSSPLTSAAPAK